MPTSPYDTHKRVMSAFLAALFIYATASVAEVILRTQKSVYHRLVGNIRLFASALVTVFLLVVLAPVLGRTYTDMLKKLSESVRSSKEEAS
ncbi:unnamed protein product [Dovyalis caffra]|uniref:Uncharacterized protein n=1 Tax=Dovyalis caffra TaxID=77055 RepID=A0AAV1SC71_9ROSI|nr:unnamed protein product [Dovyalis caffra]